MNFQSTKFESYLPSASGLCYFKCLDETLVDSGPISTYNEAKNKGASVCETDK